MHTISKVFKALFFNLKPLIAQFSEFAKSFFMNFIRILFTKDHSLTEWVLLNTLKISAILKAWKRYRLAEILKYIWVFNRDMMLIPQVTFIICMAGTFVYFAIIWEGISYLFELTIPKSSLEVEVPPVSIPKVVEVAVEVKTVVLEDVLIESKTNLIVEKNPDKPFKAASWQWKVFKATVYITVAVIIAVFSTKGGGPPHEVDI